MKQTPFDLLVIFFVIIPLHLASSETLPSASPTKCHEQEQSASLEFKQSLFHPELKTRQLYHDPSKLESWKVEDGDCCGWEGVECDEGTSYVTGLDLNQSCLSGPINSKASLFRLTHLQNLNLAFNDFNHSQIPSAIGDLVELTSLNLSMSNFGVLKLTNLTSLDLFWNFRLELRNPSMETMVQFLTKLEYLDLSLLDVSAPEPDAVANLSSLTSLGLFDCNLQETFPTTIFELPRLQFLYLGGNAELLGHLPEFHLHSPIKSLNLWRTNFSGSLPTSLGNLAFLRNIPSSIGNLTQFTMLNFQDNKLSGEIPSSVGKLIQLSYLCLGMNLLSREIPNSLINLTNLTSSDLHDNQLTDMLPLSFNEFSLIIEPDTNTGLSNLSALGLACSNLSELPILLSSQSGLRWLDLSQNSIYGQIPQWFFKVHMSQLLFLNLSRNLITSFTTFKWPNLKIIDLMHNDIQGLLPIPPKSIEFYLVSNNNLSGEISPEMCQLSSIRMLDFSKNRLSGVIPPCLGNLSKTLSTLSLNGNDLYGRFPQLQSNVCSLIMIDVSDNQLEGSLPRGLANCSNLEFLNFENNHIVDTFPSWMGSLSYLKVLILRSNSFHGAIGKPKTRHQFSNLQIVDLSMNNFLGSLPFEYFDMWNAMKIHDTYDDGYYYGSYGSSNLPIRYDVGEYDYSMTIINKGILMEYPKILAYLNVIDLSSNNFTGEILNSVGSLTQLRMLNLSNNALTGSIPLSLANLTVLESLDLSSNKLSGMISPSLAQLNFLAFFNVSDNRLSGPIPQAKQFTTFENNSYEGNFGLCGVPLTKKCGNPIEAPPAPPSSASAEELNWKIVLMGFGSGLVIGVVLGLNTTSRIERRFLRFYRGWQGRQMHQIRFV
ncbi:hypothetical protein BT93_L5677 [Corymbia citriodora subsp. variegata]|uniref:Leucine-rich repeat-containing N-terminal plant-type domain-containing protein n=1 Tax=Corymbia citriodora subsp. variegata TaxID=360336 RepID=A0A8T0CVA9_CORYI|nr:hypothetical protein BT93_L5677 [Corymbia citriodora subsp. variegata]